MQKYSICFLKNMYATTVTQEELTFDEIILRFRESAFKNYDCKSKSECREKLEGIICGTLKDKQRHADNLRCRSIITYDIDEHKYNLDNLIEYIKNSLQNYTYIYYTTFSSTEEVPKIRILLFLKEEILPEQYPICAKGAAELLLPELTIDKASYSAMQAMYLPYKKDSSFKSGKNVGELYDASVHLIPIVETETKVKKTRKKKEVVQVCDNLSQPENPTCDDLSLIEEGEDLSPTLDTEEDISDFITASSETILKISDDKVKSTLARYDCNDTAYPEWFQVCQALHYNYNGDEEGLRIFTEWSLTDSRYDEDKIRKDCENKYKSIRGSKSKVITFASIIHIVNKMYKTPALVLKHDDEEVFSLPRELFPHVIRNKEGKIIQIKSTIQNFNYLCKSYGIKISYDLITKAVLNSLNIQDENVLSAEVRSLLSLNGISRDVANEYIYAMSRKNTINSFKEIMDNVIWDGQDRLEEFYNSVTVFPEHEYLKKTYLLSWVKQMLYLGLYEGKRKIARNVMVLKGNQKIGKSTWIKSLLPEHISDTYIGDNHLDTEKDTQTQKIIKYLIVELPELDKSFKKTDINAFKAFTSSTFDDLNIKYVTHTVKFMRTTSFIGTINEDIFLKDKTGSTRFYVLPVIKMNGYHNIDMLQLYKQILETLDWINFELSDEDSEKQRILNEEFEHADEMNELFLESYEVDFTDGGIYQTIGNILKQLGQSGEKMKLYRNEIARVLRKNNVKYRRDINKYLVKLRKKQLTSIIK